MRPWLWPAALRVIGRSSRRGWWHRPPFFPLPPTEFVGFRLETQYGDPPRRDRGRDRGRDRAGGAQERRAPLPGDLVAYVAWCRSIDRSRPAAGRLAVGRMPLSRLRSHR